MDKAGGKPDKPYAASAFNHTAPAALGFCRFVGRPTHRWGRR
jgi:hypothetical protein